MHILIANDDGYEAQGLNVLAQCLREQHHKVTIVAPRFNVSGCGMGLSLRKSIKVEKMPENIWVVDGTPADCVYLGLQNLIEEPVDLVISGINNGANLADDILYSGTFAAAMEARRLRLPSIALSIVQHEVEHYETAAYIATELATAIPRLEYKSLLAVLNVNLPDVPVADLRGFKATILGQRLAPEKPIKQSEHDNISEYMLAPAGDFDRRTHKIMADFEAVEQGFASVTPLSPQFEDRPYVNDVQAWLDEL